MISCFDLHRITVWALGLSQSCYSSVGEGTVYRPGLKLMLVWVSHTGVNLETYITEKLMWMGSRHRLVPKNTYEIIHLKYAALGNSLAVQ